MSGHKVTVVRVRNDVILDPLSSLGTRLCSLCRDTSVITCCLVRTPNLAFKTQLLDSSLAVHKPSSFLFAARESAHTRFHDFRVIIFVISSSLSSSSVNPLSPYQNKPWHGLFQTSPQSTEVCTDTKQLFFSCHSRHLLTTPFTCACTRAINYT